MTDRIEPKGSAADCLEAVLPGLGGELWDAGIEPQADAFKRHRKEDFDYEVSLRDLEDSVIIPLPSNPEFGDLVLAQEAYLGLDVDIQYKLFVTDPAASYSIGCVFNRDDLPSFFSDENFLLREVVAVPQLQHLADPLNLEYEQGRAVADALFHVRAWLDGRELQPEEGDVFSERGIRWRYHLTDDQQRLLQRGCRVAISVRTYQGSGQRLFPFAVTAPTRNPRVAFDYTQASSIGSVHVETFFTSRNPFEAAREVEPPRRRIEVQPLGDWALVGNGCVFTW